MSRSGLWRCDACGHDHQRHVGNICVGCPCPETVPQSAVERCRLALDQAIEEEHQRSSEYEYTTREVERGATTLGDLAYFAERYCAAIKAAVNARAQYAEAQRIVQWNLEGRHA